MKLNHDCIRDVLLYIIDNIQYTTVKHNQKRKMTIVSLKELQSYEWEQKYSVDDVEYSVYQLWKMQFISGDINSNSSGVLSMCFIKEVTPEGHTFADNIKDKKSWETAKEKALAVGGVSLQILAHCAWDYAKYKMGIS